MATLPLATAFTDSAVTEGEFKTAITDQRDYLSGLFGSDGTAATALATLGALGADTVAKTANYTVLTTDRGKVFLCSGTFTLSLTAAATLADGFNFAVINTGSGTITIDPNSTEQIDGVSTKKINVGGWAVVTCTGSAFWTMANTVSPNINYQIFTSSGTWIRPSGVTEAVVTVIGGGGSTSASILTGNNGDTSSFGAFVSATGGSAGRNSPDETGANGVGTVSTGTAIKTGHSGMSGSFGFAIGSNTRKTTTTSTSYSISSEFQAGCASTKGGYGGLAIAYITGLNSNVTVTVGGSPTGGVSTGVGGVVIVQW